MGDEPDHTKFKIGPYPITLSWNMYGPNLDPISYLNRKDVFQTHRDTPVKLPCELPVGGFQSETK